MNADTNAKKLTPGAAKEVSLYRKDIEEMSAEIGRLRSGSVTEDDFRKFRLQRGIYGQKQKPDIQMIRVKVPWGRITAEQFVVLADVADKYAGEDRKGICHVTTRQAVQLHFVKLDNVPAAMEMLRPTGLTTREACSNTVRNVTADPLAGVASDEAFDISPYAETLVRFFLRHPVCQNMPRKFKIAFSGSVADRGLLPMHDLGCLAEIKKVNGKDVRGFKIFVGGGLGATPKAAQLLEDFTPADQLLRTAQSVIAVFDRDWDYGRKYRNMARVKFLVDKIGMDEFRKRVFIERDKLKGESYPDFEMFEETAPAAKGNYIPESNDPGYQRWKSTNVIAQKQPGFHAVTIRLPLGDITSSQVRALAPLADQFSNGHLRTTVQQNLLLRWVRTEALFSLYQELAKINLNLASAERLADITSCPGADTCQLGITSSRGLATAIGKIFQNGHAQDADLKDLKIKVSGCPNSCGQHHIADIGFFGGSKTVGTHQVPTYNMLLGGYIGAEGAKFAKQFMRVPAKKVPDVVARILDIYKEKKSGSEKFREFVARVGFDVLKKELEPVATLPESPDASVVSDWGESGEFKINVGKGECAA